MAKPAFSHEARTISGPPGPRTLGARGAWTGLLTSLWATALAVHGWRGDGVFDQALGRWILVHHALPTRDLWTTATAGHPFVPTEWGYAVVVAVLGRWGTYALNVALLAALAWGVTGWAAAWPARWRPWALVNGALALAVFVPPRPEIGSYLGWWWTLESLRRYRQTGQSRSLWGLLPVVAVWATWHRSVWLVPAVWLGEMLLGDPARRRGLVGPFLAALALVNAPPSGGWTGLRFMARVANPALRSAVGEWHGLAQTGAYGLVIGLFWAVVWLGAGRAWRRRSPRPGRDGVWLAGATLASLLAVRLVPYAALGLAALATDLAPSGDERSPSRNGPGAAMFRSIPLRGFSPFGDEQPGIMAAGLLSVIVTLGLGQVAAHGGFASPWPAGVIATLRQHRATNVIALNGDTLAAQGFKPWVDGQVQLDAAEPWWPAWVRTADGRQSPAAFAARWDPASRWIVWPDRLWTGHGWASETLPAPWRPVWQGPMAWPQTGGDPVPTTVWERGGSR
ncbi:MAG: hypothetical protein M0Z53_01840 [Thermaerobacter sp.]|nr:hypothetical protein [Thermaerobacter sp.]